MSSKKQGYCSFCRVHYSNLEQHLFSAQHRSMTRQSRRPTPPSNINNNALMERFLQDVLRHHPHHYQDCRSPDEEAEDPGSPDVVVLDDSDENDDGATAGSSRGDLHSEDLESAEEIDCRPSTSRECAEIAVRPSVIQKLEGGQQQALEVVHEIESDVRAENSGDAGQAIASADELPRPPVIYNVLPRGADDRAVGGSGVPRLVLAVASDSFPTCDTENLDTYFDSSYQGPNNPSSRRRRANDPKKKPLNIDLDKLMAQKDLRAKGVQSFPVVRVRELSGAELRSIRVEPSSELAASAEANLNTTVTQRVVDGAVEGAIPKRRDESRSNMGRTREENRKHSRNSERKFHRGSRQPMPGPSRAVARDLQRFEEVVRQEHESYESRGSEMSFACGPSFHSLSSRSGLIARERNVSEEMRSNLQRRNRRSSVSRVTSDNNGNISHQMVINPCPVVINPCPEVVNPCPVVVRETPQQNAQYISLVDESYDSSGSEINFVGDDALPSTSEGPLESVRTARLLERVHIGLVDGSYGVSSCEASDGSGSSVAGAAAARQKKPRKKAQANLVDKNYGSSSLEASSDSDRSPPMPVRERNLRDRPAHLNNNQRNPSSARVAEEPQSDAEEINLSQERNPDLGDVNCESHGPEMGFHADAQLVADHSQVAVEVNPEEVDLDLENQSVHSSISNLSFDSHAFYQSANDQPQGAWGEVNLKELNVDMEVKSSGCSSSELTFDSDSPLPSVTERSLLDVDEINEDDFNLEDESCESSSSGITFDSNIPDYSVVDHPQVAVCEEEPVDLQNKSNESCVSEITFDSDIPLHSGNDCPEVAVEVIIQEEEHAYLERKSDSPSGSEINLDSNAPLSSVTNPPEVAVKKINTQKEEQAHIKNKENEPTNSEPSLDCDTLNSNPGHSEDPITDINSQKEEHAPLENRSNVLCVSETRLDIRVPFPSVIRKCEVVVKNVSQKEKHADVQGKSALCSGSEKPSESAVPPPVTEPYVGKKAKRKTKHLNTSDDYDDSELTFNYDVFPQLMTEKPQPAVSKKGRFDPKDGSAELGGVEVNVNTAGCSHSAINQPQPSLEENPVELKDKNDKRGDSKISFNSVDHPHSLPEQDHEVVKNMNLRKKEDVVLNDNNELRGLEVIDDSDVAFNSAVDELEVAFKQISLEDNDDMSLENKSSEDSCSETNSESDFPVQSTVDPPEPTVLALEHIEREGKHAQSCDSEVTFDSDTPLRSVADHLSDTGENISLEKDEDVDLEGKRGEAEGFEITLDSSVIQPVAGHTEVVQEVNHWNGHADLENTPLRSVADRLSDTGENISLEMDEDLEGKRGEAEGFEINLDSSVIQPVAGQTEVVQEVNHWNGLADLEDKMVEPRDSKTNFSSDEPLLSMTHATQDPIKEINLVREGHVRPYDRDYEPCGSGTISVSNVAFCSVIQQPQSLQKKGHANLDVSRDPSGPEMSFDSSDPCQSVAGHFQQTAEEINLKEDHIYLEDKSYKLVDFEASYDSDDPDRFVTNPSVEAMSVKEVSFRKQDHKDLENENFQPCCSAVRYNSGVHLQPEVDPPQVDCEETNFQKKELLDVEEKSSEPSDSEIAYDSDVSFQIVVNQLQTSDAEADSPEVVFVDVVSSDSDCDREVISDPSISLQLETEPPRMTVKETSSIIAESVGSTAVEKFYCKFCGYDYEASQSVTNQSKESFKIINRKHDYIILGDSTCPSCGHEVNFNVDDSDQSMTCHSQGPDCIGPEDENYESDGLERSLNLEDTSQPVIDDQLQRRYLENVGLQDRSWESSVCAVGCPAYAVSVIRQTAVRDNRLTLTHTNLETMSSESCSSGYASFQFDTDQPEEPAKKKHHRKRVTFDLRVTTYEYVPSPVYMAEAEEVAEEVTEDYPNEPDLEDSTSVPPSCSEEMEPQMREDDVEMNTPAQESPAEESPAQESPAQESPAQESPAQESPAEESPAEESPAEEPPAEEPPVEEPGEGPSHRYSDGNSETKTNCSGKDRNTTRSNFKQGTASVHSLLYRKDTEGRAGDNGDFTVVLTEPPCSTSKGVYKQYWHKGPHTPVEETRRGTRTRTAKKRKIPRQQEASPKRKRLQNDSRKKKKLQMTSESPASQEVSGPVPPDSLINIFSYLTMKEARFLRSTRKSSGLQSLHNCEEHNFNGTSRKETVITSPQDLKVPNFDRHEIVDSPNGSSPVSSVGENGGNRQNLTSTSSTTIPKKSVIKLHRTRQATTSCLENSEHMNADEVPKVNFQLTLSNHDGAKTFPKSVKDHCESKGRGRKRKWRRKAGNRNKSRFTRNTRKTAVVNACKIAVVNACKTAVVNACKTVVQKKTRLTSKKLAIWIQMKADDLVRKYVYRYSGVRRRRRFRCRTTFIRMLLKKKRLLAKRIKEVKRAVERHRNASVLPASTEEPSTATTSSSQLPDRQLATTAGKRRYRRRYYRKKKRLVPVREYELRSSCYIPDAHRMVTRLASKQIKMRLASKQVKTQRGKIEVPAVAN